MRGSVLGCGGDKRCVEGGVGKSVGVWESLGEV